MTNSIAIGLALVILLGLAADLSFGWQAHLFVGERLLDAIDWLAFWR